MCVASGSQVPVFMNESLLHHHMTTSYDIPPGVGPESSVEGVSLSSIESGSFPAATSSDEPKDLAASSP